MILSWPIPVLVMVVLSHLDIVLAQDNTAQCVQVTDISSSDPCPCTAVHFEFSMEGETSVEDNVVNIASILDGSHGVGTENFEIEKGFAKSVTASFTESNLFANGGSASYVQFGEDVDPWNEGTFYSLDDFISYVDDNTFMNGGRDICTGIDAGRELLNAAPDASAAFMFVIVYGDNPLGDNVAGCSQNARDDGITVMAIGVGDEVSDETLYYIAGGEEEYIFRPYYDELLSLVDDVVAASTVSCNATDVELAVTYGAPVVSTNFPNATIDGNRNHVTFYVDNLEDNLTPFSVVLNSCGSHESSFPPVVDIEYNDDQENSPDFTALLNTTIDTCPTDVQVYTDDIIYATPTAFTKASIE